MGANTGQGLDALGGGSRSSFPWHSTLSTDRERAWGLCCFCKFCVSLKLL